MKTGTYKHSPEALRKISVAARRSRTHKPKKCPTCGETDLNKFAKAQGNPPYFLQCYCRACMATKLHPEIDRSSAEERAKKAGRDQKKWEQLLGREHLGICAGAREWLMYGWEYNNENWHETVIGQQAPQVAPAICFCGDRTVMLCVRSSSVEG